MIELAFDVPGAPVPCGRSRVVNGHAFMPDRTRAYESAFRLYAIRATRLARWSPPDGSWFEVELDVYRARRAGDVDNFAKGALDSCNGVVWADDSAVRGLTVRLHDGDPKPRMCVRVLAYVASERVSA